MSAQAIPRPSIFRLTNKGRKITWLNWRLMNGCPLSFSTDREVRAKLGDKLPLATLGQIAAACPSAGRELARYARLNFKRVEWAEFDV